MRALDYTDEEVGRAAFGLAEDDPRHYLPVLLAALSVKRMEFRKDVLWSVEDLSPADADLAPFLRQSLEAPSLATRAGAAYALLLVGRDAEWPVAVLASCLRDGDVEARRIASRALQEVGPCAAKAVPVLKSALQDRDALVRVHAAAALVELGVESEDEGIAEAVARGVIDPSYEARRVAGELANRLGPRAAPALPALVESIRRDLHHPYQAAAVAAVGPPAVPAILDLLQNGTPEAKKNAAWALGMLGRKTPIPLASLVEILDDEKNDANLAIEAVRALGWAGRSSGEAVAALVRALRRTDTKLPSSAAQALGDLGPDARDAIPALLEAIDDVDRSDHPSVGYSAIRALERIGAVDRDAAVVLSRSLEDHPVLQVPAARALLVAGEDAAAAVPGLESRLDDANATVRIWSRCALAAIVPARKTEVLAPVIQALRASSVEECRDAVDALGALGPGAREAVPALVDVALHDERDNLANHADAALARIGIDDLSPVLGALRSEDRPLRDRAMNVLERLKAPPAAILPDLVRALDDPNQYVRAGAARTLGKMGEAARPSLPALQRATEDRREYVRSAARDAGRAITGR